VAGKGPCPRVRRRKTLLSRNCEGKRGGSKSAISEGGSLARRGLGVIEVTIEPQGLWPHRKTATTTGRVVEIAGLTRAAHNQFPTARAQLSRKSRGVLRFGPCDGAMTLPSGPIAGSRSGRDTVVLPGVAPGGRTSPALASTSCKAKHGYKHGDSCNPGEATGDGITKRRFK
jgi:hypothetical protein